MSKKLPIFGTNPGSLGAGDNLMDLDETMDAGSPSLFSTQAGSSPDGRTTPTGAFATSTLRPGSRPVSFSCKCPTVDGKPVCEPGCEPNFDGDGPSWTGPAGRRVLGDLESCKLVSNENGPVVTVPKSDGATEVVEGVELQLEDGKFNYFLPIKYLIKIVI